MKFNLKNIFCKKTESQFLYFSFVGITTTAIYLALLILLTERFEIHYLISATLGGLISSTINFSLNKRITFKEKTKKDFLKEYWKFGAIKVITGLVSLAVIFAMTDMGGINYFISSTIVLGITSITGFLANKFITFNN